MKRVEIFTILFLILFTGIISAQVPNYLHLNIQTENSGSIVTGTFDFQFNITTDSACSNVLYSNSSTLITDSRGIISYYLDDINLNFSEPYYLCEYRNGVLQSNSKIASVPYSLRAKNVSANGIINDSNINIDGYNISSNYLTLHNQWLSQQENLGLDLTDDGSSLNLHANVGGVNSFILDTDGAFLELFANPGPANDDLMLSLTETQGDDTQILFYEGGTGNNRFYNSGSSRFGGGVSSLCSALTSEVDCNTPSTGADIVLQDDFWNGGNILSEGTDRNNWFLGNTSIGTKISNMKLDVNGSTNITGDLYLGGTAYIGDLDLSGSNVELNSLNVSNDVNITGKLYAGSGSLIVDTLSKRIGIGINPLYTIDVISEANTYIRLNRTSDLFSLGIFFTDLWSLSVPLSSEDLRLVPKGGSQTESIGFNISTGNVGLGTYSPTQKLDVRGNGNFSGNVSIDGSMVINGASRVRANRATAQSIPDSTYTIIHYDSAEDFDNLGEWNGTAFIPKESGYYMVTGSVMFGSVAWTLGKNIYLRIYKNGVVGQVLDHEVTDATTSLYGVHGTDIIYLSAGDFIDFRAYQNRGGATNLQATEDTNYIAIHRLS